MPRLRQLCDPYDPATFTCVEHPTPTGSGGQSEGDVGERPARQPTHHEYVAVFRKALPTFKKHALSDEAVPQDERQAAADKFAASYGAALDKLDADLHAQIEGFEGQRLDCFLLCRVRERCLLDAGFKDIFQAVKVQENATALEHLPTVLQELDGQGTAEARWELALHGVFAGNIFDMGSADSAELFDQGGASSAFAATRGKLLPRPWVIDDLDRMVAKVTAKSAEGSSGKCAYSKAVLLVDNAGSDVVLGMLPLARELLKAGCEVVLGANGLPSCNDVTAEELSGLLASVVDLDSVMGAAFLEHRLRVIATHSERLPVIDLCELSEEMVNETASAQLLVLEGMGRAVESNLYARFQSIDVWKLGMIKHQPVADGLRGRMYDCVCKFDEAT